MTNSAAARADDVARWVEEGGRGPEPDRDALQQDAAPRSPLPWLFAAGISGAALLAFLRRSRGSGTVFGRLSR